MAFQETSERIKFYNEVIKLGCCKRCALRYIGYHKNKYKIPFHQPNSALVNYGILPPEQEFETEPSNKMKRPNHCTVCLGLLQDHFLDEMFGSQDFAETLQYRHTAFIPYITFPTCLLVRDHGMKIHLKRTFPDVFDATNVIKINIAWRYTVQHRLEELLNKKYDSLSKFTLHFYTHYILENDEVSVMQNFRKKGDSYNEEPQTVSRQYLHSLLESVADEDFCNFVTVPPRVPLYGLTFKGIKCFSEAIHLMGSYCKYSRELLQVPYRDGDVVITKSVKTIIEDAVKSIAHCRDIQFTASSFDDQNIRVLGNGRTFHLTLFDPFCETVTPSDCQLIEDMIKRGKDISVHNLKEAEKREISTTINSEHASALSFKLLCIVYKCKNIDYCVNAVNMYRSLRVRQKTPIKVLQNRPQIDRERKIYTIRAKKLRDNLIELDLCVQCGFSVIEFVNGDFGRTRPSLCDIMKAKVDVLAVDVMALQTTHPGAEEEDDDIII